MVNLQEILPSNLFEVVERSGLSSSKEVLLHSTQDLQKFLHLNVDDITFIKNLVAAHVTSKIQKSDLLLKKEVVSNRISTGCDTINDLLLGGLRRGTITEIHGESGSGKTQIAIQAAIHNWEVGCVYLCTEDLFPTKRFEQLKQRLPKYSQDIDFGNNVFIEHVTEVHELLCCVNIRLPKLLLNNKVSLVVIDSVAAPYRSDVTNYVQRAEELRELAIALITLAQHHNFAVLCINQVTAAFDESDSLLPSLGLAWSNLISTRLCLKKTNILVSSNTLSSETAKHVYNIYIRELSVNFAPDLPNKSVKIFISSNGIEKAEV